MNGFKALPVTMDLQRETEPVKEEPSALDMIKTTCLVKHYLHNTKVYSYLMRLASGDCDEGWEYLAHTDSCYLHISTEKIIADAKDECLSHDAHLTPINSQEELTFASSKKN